MSKIGRKAKYLCGRCPEVGTSEIIIEWWKMDAEVSRNPSIIQKS